jgi:hypothetical protein
MEMTTYVNTTYLNLSEGRAESFRPQRTIRRGRRGKATNLTDPIHNHGILGMQTLQNWWSSVRNVSWKCWWKNKRIWDYDILKQWNVIQDRLWLWALVNMGMNIRVPKTTRNLSTSWVHYSFLRKDLLCGDSTKPNLNILNDEAA